MTFKPIHKITIGLSLLLILGCSPASNEALVPTYVAETAAARQAATANIEQVLADVLTGSAPPPTLTPTPTATATPTATPTPSPTPNPSAEVIVELAQIREGPGIAYKVIRNAALGDTFEVVGRSADGRWLVVSLVLDQVGWLFTEQVQELDNVERLAIVEAPPTPQAKFTITIVNNLKSGALYINIAPTIINVRIQNGESLTLTIQAGTYTIRYGSSSYINCTKTIKINQDIYWAPTSGAEDKICASFP